MAEDAFPTSGSIDPKAFPFLLMKLHQQEATGSLKVDGPTYQKALYFRGGRVLFGSSNDPKDQLGSILIESGRISPEQLEEVNTKVGPGSPLAKVLAESGFVSQRELSDAARAKVERILSDVMSYETGSFDFEDGVLPKGAVDLKLATDKLVLAAVRRVSERAFVLRHIESLEAVLAPTPGTMQRLADIATECGHLGEFLDGRRTLKEAAAAAHLDEFDAAKVACGLLFLGLVERATPTPDESDFAMVDSTAGLDLAHTARMAFSAEEPVDEDGPTARMRAPVEEDFQPTAQMPVPVEIEPEPALDPAAFALPKPTAPERKTKRFEPDTLFIEPGPQPKAPAARAASDTRPPAASHDIDLPSLGHSGFEAAGATTDSSPKTRPPSRDDLAALDALLNTRNLEGPLAPLEKPQEPRWEPRAGQTASRLPQARLPAGGGSRRALWAVVALLALVVAAGGVWYQFFRGAGRGVRTAALPSPLPPVTTTTTTTLPRVEDTTTTTLTPAAVASPSPVTMATPPPTTMPTLTRPSPPPPTPAPHPSPAGKHAGAASLVEARGAMEKGDFAGAARDFAANLRNTGRGAYSVQLLVACSEETLAKASQNVTAQELFIVSTQYKGRSCYRICWGVYESEASARSATGTVPEYFRKGGASPKAVSIASILP